MKLSILQEDLHKGLTTVSRSVSNKATLPILSNILLETENGRLKLSATNLETGINLLLGVKIEEEGSITIPAKILTELVSSLPGQKLELETKESTLYLSSGSFRANISGLDSGEFPKIPSFTGKSSIVFEKKDLVEALSQVTVAAAQDEGRPVLTGVLFKVENGEVNMVATDGYRLSIKKIKVKESKETTKFIIPAKALLEVARISQEVAGEGSEVSMELTPEKGQVIFHFPDIEFSSRLIDGDFPDVNKIIPTNFTTKISFGRDEFIRSVKLASIFAREQANIIKIRTDEGKILISSETAQVGANESSVEAKIEGENLEVAFNYRFLLDYLGVIDKEEVVFETSGSLSPGAFKNSDETAFLHIVMPVRIQS